MLRKLKIIEFIPVIVPQPAALAQETQRQEDQRIANLDFQDGSECKNTYHQAWQSEFNL